MVGQIVIWWLAASFLGLAGLPLTAYMFRTLPDRGYAFARPLGLLLTGYLAWLLAMLGLAPFGAGLLVVCAVLICGLGVFALRRRGATPLRLSLPALTSPFGGWRSIVAYELIFLLALVFMALLRARNPDPWDTERPMDFAFFNAIRRSSQFPPHDPWLSGFSINYYYFGYMLMAAMALLTNLEPGVAFNLSLALVFALTAIGIAGVVSNLIRLTLDREQLSNNAVPNMRRSSPVVRWLAVVFAIAFVLLLGNQSAPLQVVTGYPMVTALSGGDMLRAVQNGLGPRNPLYLNQPIQPWGDAEPTRVITPEDRLKNFDWWWSSRSLWDRGSNPSDSTKYYAITEFPMFSFWLGDMHPHVMALPFGLLALALALATFARPAAPVFTLSWHGWLELGVTGVVLGSLYAINSWDFPTYLLLYLLALVALYVRLGRANGSERSLVLWQQLAQHAILVVIASFMLLAPFYLTFKSFAGGKEPLIALPLLSTLTSTIGFVTWGKTPLHTFLIIFGLFLLPLAGFVFAQGRALRFAERRAEAADVGRSDVPASLAPRAERLGIIARPASAPTVLEAMPWVVVGALVLGLVAGFPLLFLLPLAVYAFMLALRLPEQPGQAFVLLALALGSLVCFGTEIVYIRDNFEGGASRMNTIFKFYYQVWLIWGMLAGYALWWLVTRAASYERSSGNTGNALASSLRWVVVVVTLAFALGGLVYPWLTAGRALTRQPIIGLNGKTPREKTPGGAAGIAWLRANTHGSDIVLESVGNSYDGSTPEEPGGPGGAGVSASTGLATVLGWYQSHERLWRAGDPAAFAQIAQRRSDVGTIYSTTDVNQARELLTKYGVDYVYVGEAERNQFAQAGLDKFVQLGKVVFQQGEVVIYRVNVR